MVNKRQEFFGKIHWNQLLVCLVSTYKRGDQRLRSWCLNGGGKTRYWRLMEADQLGMPNM